MTAVPSHLSDQPSHGSQNPLPASQPSRLLRLPEVMARVGMKRSTIYQRMSDGRFPKSRSLGPKCAVWIEAEIEAWIAAIAAPTSAQG